LNQRFWIPDQVGNDIKKIDQKFQMFGGLEKEKEKIRNKFLRCDKLRLYLVGLSPNTLLLVKFLNFERDEKKKYLPCLATEIFFLKVVAKI